MAEFSKYFAQQFKNFEDQKKQMLAAMRGNGGVDYDGPPDVTANDQDYEQADLPQIPEAYQQPYQVPDQNPSPMAAATMYYNGYEQYPGQQAPEQMDSRDILNMFNQFRVQPSPQMFQYMQNYQPGQVTHFSTDKSSQPMAPADVDPGFQVDMNAQQNGYPAPPNPCPKGSKKTDCIKNQPDTADFSKMYQGLRNGGDGSKMTADVLNRFFQQL